MDTEKLRELISKAIKAGLKPQPVMPGTAPQIAQYLLRQISTDESIQKEILQFFASQAALELFNSKIFNFGGSWGHVTHEGLLQWLLYTVSRKGIETAVSDLEKYLKLDFNPAKEILAVSGIEVEIPISLSSSLTLVPFSNVPSSLHKEAYDPQLLMNTLSSIAISPHQLIPAVERLPTAALMRDSRLSPKCVDKDEDIYAHVPQNSLYMYEACECLTLIGKCTPLPVAHWHILDEWVPCRDSMGAGWSSPIHDVINPLKCKISSGQAAEVRSLCDRFFKLAPEVREKLRVPIQRLNQARRRRNLADKAIALGVSFESLYLGDRSHKDQIAFTFRIRGAWHLGKDKQERQNLIDTFNKIYECRSVAVHTGKLDYKIKVKRRGQVETAKFLEEADELCVRSIIDIINSGKFPDWDEIILGTN